MAKAMNIVGNTYNNWKVVSRANSKRGHTYWNIKCQTCGKEKISEGCHLKNLTIKTCECSRKKEIRICPICRHTYETNASSTRQFCFDCSPYYENSKGRSKTITSIRKAIKRNLVAYKGGKCQICGYDKCIEAMQFHHKNPDEKDFNISGLREYTVESIQKYYDEVDKCILTCANCHFEIHAGLIDIDNINLL